MAQRENELMYVQGRMQSCVEDGAVFNVHSACEGQSTVLVRGLDTGLPSSCSFPCLPALLTVMVQVSKNLKRSHFTALFFSLPQKRVLEEGLG